MPDQSPFDNLRVVLVSPRNPLNIGAAARAMTNFGFSHLRVVNPYELAFREAQSAVGAADLLKNAEEYKTVAEAVADCVLVVGTTAARDRELHHPLHELQSAAEPLLQQLTSAPVALLFGSEKRGLSNDDLSRCHRLLRIPTRDENVSMNLGQAVAVTLYELIRRPNASLAPGAPAVASAADLDRLTLVLVDSLQQSGYAKENAADSLVEKARRLMRRLNLSADDATLLLGMLRQILWKLRRGQETD